MYFEQPTRGVVALVASCTWQSTVESAAPVYVVPDACMDLVWNGRDLLVAGPDTRPVRHAAAAGAQYVGLRFAPGRAGLLGVPASALRDARVPLEELWFDRARALRDRLAQAASREQARDELQRAVLFEMTGARAPDALVQQLLARLQRTNQLAPSVARLAKELGLTERQLLRRCNAALGYGPKLLARILRFQAFLRALRVEPGLTLAELALQLGYADQAHLSHEVAELAGRTPAQLRADAAARDVRFEQDTPQRAAPESRA